jgi:hypothetical protein
MSGDALDFNNFESQGVICPRISRRTSVQSFLVTLMMGMELLSEKLDFIIHLKQLSARKDFIEFRRREKVKTYGKILSIKVNLV